MLRSGRTCIGRSTREGAGHVNDRQGIGDFRLADLAIRLLNNVPKCSLIGDTKYGEGRHNRFFRDQFGCSRLLLAAVELAFVHPATGEALRIVVLLEDDYLAVIEQLGWTAALNAAWRG